MVEWCLGVSAWQLILSFALHNSCMLELRRRTRHAYSLMHSGSQEKNHEASHTSVFMYSQYNNDPLCGSKREQHQLCDIHTVINLLCQTNMLLSSSLHHLLAVRCDEKRSLDIFSWSSTCRTPKGKKPLQCFHYGNFQVSVFVFKISGKNLSSAHLTIHWITLFLFLILIPF